LVKKANVLHGFSRSLEVLKIQAVGLCPSFPERGSGNLGIFDHRPPYKLLKSQRL